MAAALPAKLKIPEITRFVTRRAQLEKYKPIVSYWCMYRRFLYRDSTEKKQVITMSSDKSSTEVSIPPTMTA